MPVESRCLVPGGFSSPNAFDRTVPVSSRRKNPGAINGAAWEKRYSGSVNTVESRLDNTTTIFEAPQSSLAVWWELLPHYAS